MCSSAIVVEPSWGSLESGAYLSATQVGIPVKRIKTTFFYCPVNVREEISCFSHRNMI